MVTNELRIGNRIKSYVGLIGSVYSLNKESLRIKFDNIADVHSFNIIDVNPVELSVEIIEKLPLKINWIEKSYRGKYAEFTIYNLLTLYYFTDNNTIEFHGVSKKLNYVHELQNLYYAIFGADFNCL